MIKWFQLYGKDGTGREEYMFRRWSKLPLLPAGNRGWSLESRTIGAQTAELSLVRRGDGYPRRYSAAYLMHDKRGRKDAFGLLSSLARQMAV